MSKKRKLSVAYASDFRIIGVYTTLKGYRFCWMVNNQLRTDMKRLTDFSYPPFKSSEAASFPVFHYEDFGLMRQYFLLANKCGNGFLLDQPKNLDFILLLQSSGALNDLETVLTKIRQIKLVQAAVLLDEQMSVRTRTVLYDFEMCISKALGEQ